MCLRGSEQPELTLEAPAVPFPSGIHRNRPIGQQPKGCASEGLRTEMWGGPGLIIPLELESGGWCLCGPTLGVWVLGFLSVPQWTKSPGAGILVFVLLCPVLLLALPELAVLVTLSLLPRSCSWR